jgi:hypothetical protein
MKHCAHDYLDTIDKKLQSDHWSGYAQTGCRNQTNASFGPSQQSLFGATRPINSQFVPQPDWSWFGALGLNYVHNFGNQRGDVFEANVLGYDAQQFKVTSVDTGFLDIRVGARLGIFQDGLSGAPIEPYVVATGGPRLQMHPSSEVSGAALRCILIGPMLHWIHMSSSAP